MGLERFYFPDDDPADDAFVAVGIFCVGGGQFHAAIVYQLAPDAESRLFELRGHRDLNSAVYRPSGPHGLTVFWPNGVQLPPERLQSIAATCRRIYKKHEQSGLPYSFALESSLNRHGDFIHGETDAPGFTCATFVLAVFDAAGFQLLEDDWPVREFDAEHLTHLLSELDFGDDTEHTDALVELVGKVPRYQPSEVAAGAVQDKHPASAADVEDDAEFIRESLT